MDKMKSRSGSIKSLFRTFFKKNGDVKTEKTYHTDSAVEIESKPIHILKKVSQPRKFSDTPSNFRGTIIFFNITDTCIQYCRKDNYSFALARLRL